MGIELKQGSTQPTATASFQDDASGARIAHLGANTRIPSHLQFKIDQTSPGALQGLGGDTQVTIPGGAIPIKLSIWGKLNSNTTTGTISLGLDNITSNHFLSSYNVADVPTGQGQQLPRAALNFFAALPLMPVGQAHTIVGRYSESATSTFGGPWFVDLEYYLPEPT